MDILILSVAVGGGHIKAGEAVKEVVEQKYPGSRILIVDSLKYVNPIVDKLVVGSYLNTVKNTPQIYGKLYEMSESTNNINDFSKTVNKFLSYRIKKLIHDFKPSVIVCTHPFPLQMVVNLKKKGKIHVPLSVIMTDFVVHPLWLHDDVDAYVVAHDYMKHEMTMKGIPAHTIYPYGIPISSSFLQKKDRNSILKEFRLDNKLTILVMGGTLGFGQIKDTFKSLVSSSKDLQIIAITGKNIKLKRQLENYSLYTNKKIKILSYTENVSELMDISDILITKPGGMTVSEALIKELPMFIISPIPGQETGNANFLVNNGAAIRLYPNYDIEDALYQIVDNPLRIKQMKEMSRYLAKPDASKDILSLLETLAKTSTCQI